MTTLRARNTPETTATYRIRIVDDPDHIPETPQGKPLPGSREDYAQSPVCDPETKEEMPYDEYLTSFGDPDNYFVCGVRLEEKCPHCGEWHEVQSLWGIELYRETPDTYLCGYEDRGRLPAYLAEVATELYVEHTATRDEKQA